MVVAVGRTTTNQLDGALEALETIGSKVAGVVLTMVPTKGADAYSYGYGYGYGGYGSYQTATKVQKSPRGKKAAPPDAGRQGGVRRSGDDESTTFDDLLNPG